MVHPVDQILLDYVRQKESFGFNSEDTQYFYDVLGFTTQQLSVSVERLIEKKYIVYDATVNMYFVHSSKSKKKPGMVIMPYTSSAFLDTWDKFLKHRRDRKKPYVEAQHQHQLDRLHKITDGNEQLAIEGLQHTIDSNWLDFKYGVKEVIKSHTEKQRGNTSSQAGIVGIILNSD